MTVAKFKVKPLKVYDEVRYPSEVERPSENPPEDDARTHSFLEVALLMLLMLGLSVGLLGCFGEYSSDPCAAGILPYNEDGSCGPDPEDCLPGELKCIANGNAATCEADGQTWTSWNCEDYCNDMYGIDSFSNGCDAQATDPCLCEYDIIDGGVGQECVPGQVSCLDQLTVEMCADEGYYWITQNCVDYCQEVFGAEYTSLGCDAQATDPCQCEYDLVPGVVAQCTPSQVECLDEDTAQVCQEDGYSWATQDCDEYCVEVNGYGWFSNGCDIQADDPCQCQYDMIEGMMVECVPGQVVCQDEDTAQVCNDDSWTYTSLDCDEYCTDTLGDDYYSTGCDAEDQENFCGCEYGLVDGEPSDY